MVKMRSGFTIVEVLLFLSVTALLFLGVAVGVRGSIFQQRYNDSVQSFAEYLRSIYSQVSNVQNSVGKGNSDWAIYGKLMVFGENKTLRGENNTDMAIYSYDVIGSAEGSLSSDTLNALKELNANVFYDGEYAGNVEEYKPKWSSRIQNAKNGNTPNYSDYVGAILIVRNPKSGTIYTYKNNPSKSFNININSISNKSSTNPLANVNNDFIPINSDINFCVNPNGNQPSDTRRNVRIMKGARNASGVEIITTDYDNACI